MLLYYIFILHQTTTPHDWARGRRPLYYIFILHQTTTGGGSGVYVFELYYIFILHQTTTPRYLSFRRPPVVLYLHSTSNHNLALGSAFMYISCIISSFYIKPQLCHSRKTAHNVVLYLHSTSNHNEDKELPRLVDGCIISSFYIKPQL